MCDEILVSYHDSLIRRSDVELMRGNGWLNDTLISFWFEYLSLDTFKHRWDIVFVSCEVTQLIKMCPLSELGLFMEPMCPANKSYIFLPVNDHHAADTAGGSHWSLLVYSRKDGSWYHLDSQQYSNHEVADGIVRKVNAYMGITADLIETPCTQQNNGYDCGVYVMIFANKLADFTDRNIDIQSCFVDKFESTRMRAHVVKLFQKLSEVSQ